MQFKSDPDPLERPNRSIQDFSCGLHKPSRLLGTSPWSFYIYCTSHQYKEDYDFWKMLSIKHRTRDIPLVGLEWSMTADFCLVRLLPAYLVEFVWRQSWAVSCVWTHLAESAGRCLFWVTLVEESVFYAVFPDHSKHSFSFMVSGFCPLWLVPCSKYS